jgi:hypothetical protein
MHRAIIPCLFSIFLSPLATIGAPADGTLLSTASYPSIQEAINANPGKLLFVPAGDYSISTKLRINKNGSGLFGPGRIIQRNHEQPIIHIENAENVQLRDLTLTRAEGQMETELEAVLAIGCQNLVLDNLQVLDNRTRAGAITLRECTTSQVRHCLVQNYQCISIDDRTMNVEFGGYAMRCLIGTGIVIHSCRGTLVEGNRVVERNLTPTRELYERLKLGEYVKKIAVRPPRVNPVDWERGRTDNWMQATAIHIASPEANDLTQVIGNYVENTGQGFDIHADRVTLAQNTVNDTLIGMKAMHGSRNVLILGNQFVKNDLWAIGLMPGAASHAAEPASGSQAARPANVDGGSIVMGNIISDFGYGSAHWLRAKHENDGNGFPIRFEGGQKPENPALADVVIQGNLIYDTGRAKVMVGGAPKVLPPRYRYAVFITQSDAIPQGLHFSGNVLSPGVDGISNVPLSP